MFYILVVADLTLGLNFQGKYIEMFRGTRFVSLLNFLSKFFTLGFMVPCVVLLYIALHAIFSMIHKWYQKGDPFKI